MTQDFGTSRWRLSDKITLVPLRAEGARYLFHAEASICTHHVNEYTWSSAGKWAAEAIVFVVQGHPL